MHTCVWIDSRGNAQETEVLATFKDGKDTFAVVRCARGTYDTAEPYHIERLAR